jgi:diguanylate cyclase (GGDEF)-like protein
VALTCFLIIFGGLFLLVQRGERIIRQQYSELVIANQLIEQLAYLDNLTQLPNRNSFEDSIKRQIARCKRKDCGFALLYMDLDGFKQINDRYGHAIGDLVLHETAHRLRAGIRESDLVFRMGGDEFTAVLQDISSEEIALAIADKIIAAVSDPICHQELTLNVTISLGIAIYPLHAMDIDSLIELSDMAMYQAKRAGSNCFRMAEPETA